MRHARRSQVTSISEITATVTTPARALVGRSRVIPGSETRITAIAAAPTTPVSCVRAPAASAAGVRDELLERGKPWNSPAAAFAAPRATSSWFWSTRSPSRRRVAPREDARVREGNDRDAHGSEQERPQVAEGGQGESGEAGGECADDVDATLGQVEDGDDERCADDRDQHGWSVPRDGANGDDDRDRAGSDRERPRVGLVETRDECPQRVDHVAAIAGEAEEPRELRRDHGERDAREVADAHRLRDQVGERAEASQTRDHADDADEHGERRRGHDPLVGIGARDRHDRGEDERGDGRVGCEHRGSARPHHA